MNAVYLMYEKFTELFQSGFFLSPWLTVIESKKHTSESWIVGSWQDMEETIGRGRDCWSGEPRLQPVAQPQFSSGLLLLCFNRSIKGRCLCDFWISGDHSAHVRAYAHTHTHTYTSWHSMDPSTHVWIIWQRTALQMGTLLARILGFRWWELKREYWEDD